MESSGQANATNAASRYSLQPDPAFERSKKYTQFAIFPYVSLQGRFIKTISRASRSLVASSPRVSRYNTHLHTGREAPARPRPKPAYGGGNAGVHIETLYCPFASARQLTPMSEDDSAPDEGALTAIRKLLSIIVVCIRVDGRKSTARVVLFLL